MSRPRLLRPMAPDLMALGDQLEEAVKRDVRRRRARRQIAYNAVASMMLVLPIAIGVVTATVGPADEAEAVGAGGASATLTYTPGFDLSWRHIPEKPVVTLEYAKCRDGNDCRISLPEIPFLVDFPPRRV